MNSLYFACCDCKIYIDAGYRWAYWELQETGTVQRKEYVNVEKVLAAKSYWNPPHEKSSDWLYEEIFPPLEKFLYDHCSHKVIFGEIEEFASIDNDMYLDWLHIGYCYSLTPRFFVEILNLTTWEQVCEYVALQESKPWWWGYNNESEQEKNKKKFEEIIAAQTVIDFN